MHSLSEVMMLRSILLHSGVVSDLAPQLALGVVQGCQQAIQVSCTRRVFVRQY